MVERDMLNYYLAWLHFDIRGRMTTRLPEGHRVVHVIHDSGSNRHAPALWVLVEAVASTPAYTPAAGFPAAYSQHPSGEYPQQPSGPVPGTQDYYNRYYSDGPPSDAGQNGGRTQYPELSPTSLNARADDYRNDDYRNDDYASAGIPQSPVNR